MRGTFIDKDGKVCNYVMGCYGIGVSRTLAMVYENSMILKNGKFDGISLPINIAPYSMYIIPKLDDKDKANLANKIYDELMDKEISVLYDDRTDVSIGAKIKDSRIVGAPYTVVLGKSLDNGVVEIENNRTGEKKVATLDEFVLFCGKLKEKKVKF